MGDGYWENDGKTVFICTDNFTGDNLDKLCSLVLPHTHSLFYYKLNLVLPIKFSITN
jgi:hypothetical protein